MTLHEAIIKVLLEANTPLTIDEIAHVINEQKIYVRRDGQKLSANQVSVRVDGYPELLKKDEKGTIEIVNRALHSFRITYYHILNRFRKSRLAPQDIRFIAACTIYISWLNPEKKQMRYNPEKVDFIQFFHELTSSLRPKEAMRRYMTLLEQLTAFELHEVEQFVHTPPSADKIDSNIFGAFFNDIINEYNSGENLNAGEYSTPPFISKFISSFYSVAKNGKIFDPFVGQGGTLVHAFRYNENSDPKIVAGDINMAAIQMAEMNVLANGCSREYFYHKNAFTEWNSSIEADLVVSVPPIGAKVSIHELQNQFSELDKILFTSQLANGNINIDFGTASMVLSLAHLNSNGKAAIVVPDNFLYTNKKDVYNLRQYLVFNNLVEAIISLPNESFRPFHSAKCSLILLNKRTGNPSRIFVCDASNLSIDAFRQQSVAIVTSFQNNQDANLSRWISADEIMVGDFSFDPKKYTTIHISEPDFHYITEVARVYSGTKIAKSNTNKSEGIPFLQVGDLEDSPGLNEIDLSKATTFITDSRLLSKKTPNYIPDRSVLINKIGTKLKTSLYKYRGDALCNPNIIVIKADENKILPEYLVTQMQSEYLLLQIDSIRQSSVGLIHFSQADFEYIKIKVPPLAEQREFIASFYGRKLKEEAKVTERKREDDLYNIISTLKHELKQPVSTIGMDVRLIRKFLDRKITQSHFLSWTEPVVEMLPGQTEQDMIEFHLSKIVERLEKSVENAQLTLAKAEETLNVGSGVFHSELVAIRKYVETYIVPAYRNEKCIINIIGSERELNIDKYQIGLLFRRLIENAIKHGFRRSSDKHFNVINIKLAGETASRDFFEIIVENNGSPFPEGFNKSKFETRGVTTNRGSGSGFGGFQIKQIIDNHKGELHIATNEEIGESEFKVKFKIYLPWQ